MPLNEFYGLVAIEVLLSEKSGIKLIGNNFKNEYKDEGIYSRKKKLYEIT